MTNFKPSGAKRHTCAVCGQERTRGSLLTAADTDGADTMWVCDDCQHKLSRRVDDEGILGG